jgi:penicillin-binding protein 1B
VRQVLGTDGSVVEKTDPKTRPVLDPRVAYLVTTLMEDVMSQGTGAVVRSLGFDAPAAGKTGTSRDGWFAGFTSNLICVVWVGFDDNRDLGLSGTAAAAPIWAEFMKRAVALPSYRKVEEFDPPPGVTEVTVDPQSEQLATPNCPTTKQEVFLAGTEPTQYCFLHGGRAVSQAPPVSWLSHLFGKGGSSEPAPPGSAAAANGKNGAPGQTEAGQGENQGQDQDGQKKKGLLQKIFGIFGGKKPAEQKQPEQQPPPKSNP